MTVITRKTLRNFHEQFFWYYAVKSVNRQTYIYHHHRTFCGHHAKLYTTSVPHISNCCTKMFNKYGAVGHKNEMISHKTVKCSSYYSIKTLQNYRMIPNHNVAFIPSSHKSKNSFAMETGFLHSQKFTNSH
jgi:hypothetical protein